jgi:hypothetical protein
MQKKSKFLLNVAGKKYRAATLLGILWKYLTGKES